VSWVGVQHDLGTRDASIKHKGYHARYADIASVTLDTVVPAWEQVYGEGIAQDAGGDAGEGVDGVRATVRTDDHFLGKICAAKTGPRGQTITGCEHTKTPAYIVAVEAPHGSRRGDESLGLRVTGGEDVYDASAGEFSMYLQLEKKLLMQHADQIGEATVAKRIHSWLQDEAKKDATWRVQYLAYVGDWPVDCKTGSWSPVGSTD
jgi:hypothetical protein